MLAVVPSATLHGLDGRLIRVEVDVAPGLPGFPIVGLADTAVQEARDRVFTLFPRLAERTHQPAGLLSGGEQQMLAIGRALMAAPRLLLLDEPSLGLAPQMVHRIAEVIREINEQGTAVLLVEQNAGMTLSLASHAHVLEVGETRLSGPAGELARTDAVRRLYLGEPAQDQGAA